MNHLRVAPSHIHPNAWGFIRGFEMLHEVLDFPSLSVNLFLHLFRVINPVGGGV